MGGYMGLLLGASIVTFVEVIDVVLINWGSKKKTRPVSSDGGDGAYE